MKSVMTAYGSVRTQKTNHPHFAAALVAEVGAPKVHNDDKMIMIDDEMIMMAVKARAAAAAAKAREGLPKLCPTRAKVESR